MARASDTVTFNPELHKKTVETMRSRREEVHATGKKVYEETGRLDKLVDITAGVRVSRNSMTKDAEKFVLSNGIALPIWSPSDGTGSMGENLAKTLYAMDAIETLLDPIRALGYNTQLASGVAQDVCDSHPVGQMSQFETDNRRVDEIKLLVPDSGGGDETEDYQILLAYAMLTETDIYNFYGLKGYAFLMADQICRESLDTISDDHTEGNVSVLNHVKGLLKGRAGLQRSATTKAINQELLRKWHYFYLQVGHGGPGIADWWKKRGMENRVVQVPDADYLAEVQAALIFVTEMEQANKDSVVRFLVEGTKSNKRVSKRDAEQVWGWISGAGIPFGAQFKLRAGKQLPKPGDIFAHWRHAWPEGHPKASENVTPTGEDEPSPKSGGKKAKSTGGLDWSKF